MNCQFNNKFKDYIACPKTNKYRSIHTTVFTPDNQLLQFQIKTEEMDYLNTFGLAAYWRMYREQGPSKMKTELKSNYQFFNNLQHLNDFGLNDFEYLELVKNEIFTTNIYVYTLDADKEPELAALFAVSGYPTVVLCPMTGSPQKVAGYNPLEFWQEAILQVFGIAKP